MATIAKLDVLLGLEDGEFQRGLEKSRKKLEQWGSSLRSTGTKMTAGITTPLIGAGLVAVNWASDLEQAMGKSDAVFKTSSAAVIEWSKTTADAYGFSSSQSLAMASSYGALFKVMGMTDQIAADYSMRLIGLAADMAAFNDVSNERASEALMSGLSGEYMSLRSMGVFLNEAAVSQEALNIAMADGRTEITEADKVQARYNLILEQTEQQHGQAAREMDGWASSVARARAKLQNLGAEIGRKIMPFALKLLAWAEDVVSWFTKLSDRTQYIIIAVAGLAAAMGPLLLVLGMLLPGISALLGVIGFLVSPIGLVVAGVALLVAGLVVAYTQFEGFRAIVDATASVLMDIFEPALNALLTPIRDVIGDLGELNDLVGKVFGKKHETTATMETRLDGDAAVHEVIYDENGIRRDMVMTIAEDGSKETFGEIIESYVDPENERIAHIRIQPEGDGEAFWTTIDLETGKIESVEIEVKSKGAAETADAIRRAYSWAVLLEKINPFAALQRGSDAAAAWLNEMGFKMEKMLAKFATLGIDAASAVGDVATVLAVKGAVMILGFWTGATEKWASVRAWFVNLGVMSFNAVGVLAATLVLRGNEIISGFYESVTSRWVAVRTWFGNLGTMSFNAVGSLAKTLWERGTQVLTGFYSAVVDKWTIGGVREWFTGLGGKIVSAVGDIGSSLYNAGLAVMDGLWNGLKARWNDITGWLSSLNPADWKGPERRDKKMLYKPGIWIMEGLQRGLSEGWVDVTRQLSAYSPSLTADTGIRNALAGAPNLTAAGAGMMGVGNPITIDFSGATFHNTSREEMNAWAREDFIPAVKQASSTQRRQMGVS